MARMRALNMNAGQIGLLVATSAGAGVMNAMAGGGTILTYPALLFVGERARRGREFELGAVQFLGQQPQVLAAPPDQHRDDDARRD